MTDHKRGAIPSALLVADAPGHILERIGRSWLARAGQVRHELAVSGWDSSFSICRRARQLGVAHWIDQIACEALGRAVAAAQVVMVHHWTDDALEAGLASLRYCDAITTSSVYWKAKLERLAPLPVTLIPYSIDTRTFCPPIDRQSARRAAGIGSDRFVLGFLGKAAANQSNRKGIDVLLAVLEAAGKRWRDIAVVLVGPGWQTLAAKIESFGVSVFRYEFATTEETAAAYALMDAMLVTSSEEGGPCTILEAMACGVPVITSVVGHVPEVVEDGKNGLLCRSRQPGEYLDRLEALKSRPELSERLREEGRTFVVRERDDRVVVPNVDFASLYAGAMARYRMRSRIERASRELPLPYFYARHVARPLRPRLASLGA